MKKLKKLRRDLRWAGAANDNLVHLLSDRDGEITYLKLQESTLHDVLRQKDAALADHTQMLDWLDNACADLEEDRAEWEKDHVEHDDLILDLQVRLDADCDRLRHYEALEFVHRTNKYIAADRIAELEAKLAVDAEDAAKYRALVDEHGA